MGGAWRRGVEAIERAEKFPIAGTQKVERIETVEVKRIVRLRLDIHPDDLKPCPLVAHRGTAGTTEEV
jgi:hypothetical protein